MSEPKESGSKSRFRITSIIIAMAMIVGALGALIGPLTTTVSATITGDTYSGSGNFVVTQDTVYDGTNLHVYGNIYINQSSLTIRHATLTMDESSQYQHNIYVNWSYQTDRALKLKYAYLDVSNSSDNGTPMVKIIAAPFCSLWISNSTVNHTSVDFPAWLSFYVDNSTVHASRFLSASLAGGALFNVSHNTFKDCRGAFVIGTSTGGATITENTFTNITRVFPGYPDYYRGMISICGDGTTGNVSILKNHFDHIDIQGIDVSDSWSNRISYNVFENVSDSLLVDDTYGGAAAIGVSGDGKHPGLSEWSYIDNNTIKNLYGGNLLPVANPGNGSSGITAGGDAKHWKILYNSIWDVRKRAGGYQSIGIDVGGGTVADGTSSIYVCYNAIGNVSGAGVDQPGGQSKGIRVNGGGGSFNGPYLVGQIFIDRNTFQLVNESSQAIELWYMVHNIYVTNNTITLLKGYDGSGIGVYNQPSHILISDNSITMWRDVWGINLAHNHTYATVVRNTIHVLAQAHFYDQGIWAFGRGGGAIAVNDENDAIYQVGELHWTAVGDYYANNTITQESYSEFFPEYTILNCSHQITIGAPGPWPKIVLDQDAIIYSWHANFSVWGSAIELPILTRTGASTAVTVSGTEWYVDFRDTEDFYFTNVSLTPLGAASDDDVNITVDIWDPLAIGSPILSFIGEASSGTEVVFEVGGLTTGATYQVYVDGVGLASMVASGSQISFAYSVWSNHTVAVYAGATYAPPDDTLIIDPDRSPSTSDPGETSFTWTSPALIVIVSGSLLLALLLLLRRPRGRSGTRHS